MKGLRLFHTLVAAGMKHLVNFTSEKEPLVTQTKEVGSSE